MRDLFFVQRHFEFSVVVRGHLDNVVVVNFCAANVVIHAVSVLEGYWEPDALFLIGGCKIDPAIRMCVSHGLTKERHDLGFNVKRRDETDLLYFCVLFVSGVVRRAVVPFGLF